MYSSDWNVTMSVQMKDLVLAVYAEDKNLQADQQPYMLLVSAQLATCLI
jgi:hypothetical protein